MLTPPPGGTGLWRPLACCATAQLMAGPCCEVVIFDLDGVITKTALVHSKAWKQTFDEYLRLRETRDGELFKEFTHEHDYLAFVDGKPRYDGVASFLTSRGIDVPRGSPDDPPDTETVCGLGNRKNELVTFLIGQGVEVFPSTVRLIEALRACGVRVGVASSSKNCKAVLAAAGLESLFEARVDGVVSAERGLTGKPAPDIFLEACADLGASPERSVVVEDAVSGVRAGARGDFGLVIGVAREGNHEELKKHGADITVDDLEEVNLELLEAWFQSGLPMSTWSIVFDGLQRDEEALRETLCTVGNGYFGTRGALEERDADSLSYPGTYLAGVYNRLESHVAGRTINNEDLVNCPNWLNLTFRIDDGEWIDPDWVEVVELQRRLDLHHGMLGKRMVVRDGGGRETEVISTRLASMAEAHLGALRYSVTPLNYSGTMRFRSRLDGDIINNGVPRYRQLASRHLSPTHICGEGVESSLVVQTTQSKIEVALAARIGVQRSTKTVEPDVIVETSASRSSSEFDVEVDQGETISVDKIIAIVTSRDVGDPLSVARSILAKAGDFSHIAAASTKRWVELWNDIDVRIEGDRRAQLLLRLHIYHLLCTASPHNAKLDVSIPARGLHGEAYRGHVFWDVSFVLPFYSMHLPEVARAVLDYRYRRLDSARAAARAHGYEGAMFPWQSGNNGREESQVVHLNPISGEWGPDNSSLQRHVSLAIAMDLWNHRALAVDRDFFENRGTKLFLEICRFWADVARRDATTGRFVIEGVMGPDEYHEESIGSSEAGLKDNSYTNLLVSWAFGKAGVLLDDLEPGQRASLLDEVGLSEEELERWDDIRRHLNIAIEDGILAQFDGYFELEELDWERYRRTHGDIHRMDRILKAEGDSPDRYKVAKQPDALMAFFSLLPGEPEALIGELVHAEALGERDEGLDFLERNYDYHFTRTSHGSTLSKVVHSYIAALLGRAEESYELYLEALESDYADVQGGTTPEGIHVGVMGGTVLTAIRGFAGVELGGDRLRINPRLPARWREMCFGVTLSGNRYEITVKPSVVKVLLEPSAAPAQIEVRGEVIELEPGSWTHVELEEDERREDDVE